MHTSPTAGMPAARFEYHPAWQCPSGRFMEVWGICPADAGSRNDDDNLENENVSGGQAFPDAGKRPREKQPETRPPSEPDQLDQPHPPTADPDYRQYPPETVTPDPHKAYPPTDPAPTAPQPEIIDEEMRDSPSTHNPQVPPPGGFVIRENAK